MIRRTIASQRLIPVVRLLGFVRRRDLILLLQEHDSHKIVIDEVVGYLAATLFLAPTWPHAMAAFLIFRVLDVIKPYPAGYIDEHMPGGAGVVLDDVVSGFYTNAIVRVLILLGVLS